MSKKFTVGILYICTGPYIAFWKNFYKSCEKYFLPECDKKYFVFTDAKKFKYMNHNNVTKIYQQQREWPYPTLMRFQTFLNSRELYSGLDYLFFFNSNCKFMTAITCDMILPNSNNSEDFVVCEHPYQSTIKQDDRTYDRNPKSTAYIKYGCGDVYVCGGLIGGYNIDFINLCEKINNNIKIDKKNNVCALWHDESHLNKYCLENKNFKLLNRNLLNPEEDLLHDKTLILLRDKSKYLDVKGLKKKKWLKN